MKFCFFLFFSTFKSFTLADALRHAHLRHPSCLSIDPSRKAQQSSSRLHIENKSFSDSFIEKKSFLIFFQPARTISVIKNIWKKRKLSKFSDWKSKNLTINSESRYYWIFKLVLIPRSHSLYLSSECNFFISLNSRNRLLSKKYLITSKKFFLSLNKVNFNVLGKHFTDMNEQCVIWWNVLKYVNYFDNEHESLRIEDCNLDWFLFFDDSVYTHFIKRLKEIKSIFIRIEGNRQRQSLFLLLVWEKKKTVIGLQLFLRI